MFIWQVQTATEPNTSNPERRTLGHRQTCLHRGSRVAPKKETTFQKNQDMACQRSFILPRKPQRSHSLVLRRTLHLVLRLFQPLLAANHHRLLLHLVKRSVPYQKTSVKLQLILDTKPERPLLLRVYKQVDRNQRISSFCWCA